MAHLLADENFPWPVVIELRRLGHDAADMEGVGLAHRGISDAVVLDIATRERRAVLTLDRGDFYRLHRSRDTHGGIVACTQDVNWVRMAARIDAAISAIDALTGQYIRVTRPGPTSA